MADAGQIRQSYDAVLPWHPELYRKKCERIEEFGEATQTLYERMKASMFALNGQGLAAPQIGIFKQAAVILYDRNLFPVFNPEILEQSGDEVAFEGCLSLPGCSNAGRIEPNRVRVHRSTWIRVRYQDVDGAQVSKEFNDHPARVFAHELDHTLGIFVIDRCGPLYRDVAIAKYKKWRHWCRTGVLYG